MAKKSSKGYVGKMKETRDFISNVWLKDNTRFCANCGKKELRYRPVPCCNAPYIVDNVKRIQDFASANKENKELLINEYGASKGNNMRHNIRMPAELMKALQAYFGQKYGEDFLVEKGEGRAFMKEFPQFTVAERI